MAWWLSSFSNFGTGLLMLTLCIDLYHPQNFEDLRKFFVQFMKGKSNGREFTPRLRPWPSILDPGHDTVVNRPEAEFPLSRQRSCELFLNAETGLMSLDRPETETRSRSTLPMGLHCSRIPSKKELNSLGTSKQSSSSNLKKTMIWTCLSNSPS